MSDVYCFKVRIGVVLIRDGKLLLVRQNNRPFWVLPGGTLEPGESMADCACREMREETSLEVSIDRMLYTADFVRTDGRHAIDVVFLVRYVSGEPVMETTENINEMLFADFDEVTRLSDNHKTEPRRVFRQLLVDWKSNFSACSGLYLGKYEQNA